MKAFISLFSIKLSGTHASIEERLNVIESLLCVSDTKMQRLGLLALERILETLDFRLYHHVQFGARPRDNGYEPKSRDDTIQWYGSAIRFIERFSITKGNLKLGLRDMVARKFRGLWAMVHMEEDLERLISRFITDGFWREGWIACREMIRYSYSRMSASTLNQLVQLEAKLRPSTLLERVQTLVLDDSHEDYDEEERTILLNRNTNQLTTDVIAYELGLEVALDNDVFMRILPDLFQSNEMGNICYHFGRGLAFASLNRYQMWDRIIAEFQQGASDKDRGIRNIGVVKGYIAEIWEMDKELANKFLDTLLLDKPLLAMLLPSIHTSIGLDAAGSVRLKQALKADPSFISLYRSLNSHKFLGSVSSEILKDIVLFILDQDGGCDIAIAIISTRLYIENERKLDNDPIIIDLGQKLLQKIKFVDINNNHDHALKRIANLCIRGDNARKIAVEVVLNLRDAIVALSAMSFQYQHLLSLLMEREPLAILNALFDGDADKVWASKDIIKLKNDNGYSLLDVLPSKLLIQWCDADSIHRYPLAAEMITFASNRGSTKSLVWSEHAQSLLMRAPDHINVLEIFIKRFFPLHFSEAPAVAMEKNARLLDSVHVYIPEESMNFVTEAKISLQKEIDHLRMQEREDARYRNERFEW